jgi:hypothetical protein
MIDPSAPCEWTPFPEVQKLLETSDQAAERGSLNTYKMEAAALGRAFDTLHQKINVTNELAKLSFVKGQHGFAPLLEATWRLLSGFEHGFGWALLSGTDRKVQAQIPGGATLELVISDDAFVK